MDDTPDALAEEALRLTNEARQAEGLEPLSREATLIRAAEAHGREMADSGAKAPTARDRAREAGSD